MIFPFEYWDSYQKFKEGLPSKDRSYSTLTNRKIRHINYEHVLNFSNE